MRAPTVRRHWRACGNLPRVLSDPGFKFCPKCGSALHKRRLKQFEPERLLCPGCGYVMYLNPKVAAGAVVEHRGGIAFLHEVRDGPANRSYGLQVARLAGLPGAVVRSTAAR